MVEIDTGVVLSSRYTVGQRLGAGGTGVVWQARDGVLDRDVALKVVHSGEHARLAREAKAAARVNHGNVVAVYDAGEDDGTVFLIMELVRGIDLGQVLRGRAPLPPDVVALIGRELARGLGAVHEEGLIHRDVKPSNVLMTGEGQVKLSDLGIARTSAATRSRQLTETGTVVGTIDYLAPEQLGEQRVTAAADVYALGLLLLEICTGDKPFGEGTVAERATRRLVQSPEPPATLHAALREVIGRAVRRDPGERPADGHAFADELLGAVVDEAAARTQLIELVQQADAAPGPEQLHEPSPSVRLPTEEYTPAGVQATSASDDGTTSSPTGAAGPPDAAAHDGAVTGEEPVGTPLPTPGRLAIEAIALAGLVALVVTLSAALVS